MAGYKYQQNFYDGASAGYVKYNITPDFGTCLAPGETFTVTGQAFCKSHAVKAVGVMLCADAEPFSSSAGYEAAVKEVNIGKGKVGTFSVTAAFYNDIARLDASDARAFKAYLQFDLQDADGGSDGTMKAEAQCIAVLKERLAPVIERAELVGSEFVQNETEIIFEYRDSFDPIDPAVTAEKRTLTLGGRMIEIAQSGGAVGTCSAAGTVPWVYTVTDSKGKSASVSGTIEVLPYAEPILSELTAERYAAVTDDEGNLSYVASDDGEHVWFSLAGEVSSLSGANPWTLTCEGRTVLSGEDGTALDVSRDRTMFEDAVGLAQDVTFTFILSDRFHSVVKSVTVSRSGAIFNIEKHGAAFGMRTSGTQESPKLESAWPAHFYAGVYAADGSRLDEVRVHVLTDEDLTEYFTVEGCYGGYSAAIARFGRVCILSGQLMVKKQYSATSQQVCIREMPSWAQPMRHQDIWTPSRYGGDFDIRQRIFADSLKLYVQYSTAGTANKGPAAGKMIALHAVWMCQ